MLVHHFVHTYAQRLRTRIDTIPADVRTANWVVSRPQGAAVCLGASSAPP
jgi:hypothetical protein